MNAINDFDRRAAAWLADGPSELNDRVLEAALREVHLTQQRRALRMPWRFPFMPALSRTAGIAAVALVAVVGAGGLLYMNSGAGGQPTPTPTPAPTEVAPSQPTIPPTSAPSIAPGSPTSQPTIPSTAGWNTYQSEVYSFTIGYPQDWALFAKATRFWQPGDSQVRDAPNADLFVSPDQGDAIGMSALKVPVGTWGDDGTDEGLIAWVQAFCEDEGNSWCNQVPDLAQSICIRPENPDGTCPKRGLLLPTPDTQYAFTRETFSTGASRIIVVIVGRPDDFVTARPFGGAVNLLRAVMTTIRG